MRLEPLEHWNACCEKAEQQGKGKGIMSNEPSPVFGIQASWICYKTGGCEYGVPDNVDIAFIFLETFRTKAEKHLEFLLASGMKKETALKESGKLPDGDAHLTRIQCPYLEYDEEGDFENVHWAFIKIAKLKAEQMAGKTYGEDESCTTTSWQGECRKVVSNYNGESKEATCKS